jgi:hypothetical protein
MRSIEEQINSAIEDTEYGTLASTVECSNKAEFDDLLKTYEEAQHLRALALTPGWMIMRERLIAESNRRANDLLRVNETDDKEVRNRKSKQAQADHARNFVISMVEEADETPRPILVKQR